MEKYEQDEFMEFDYNGETLCCRIPDNNEPMRFAFMKMEEFRELYLNVMTKKLILNKYLVTFVTI